LIEKELKLEKEQQPDTSQEKEDYEPPKDMLDEILTEKTDEDVVDTGTLHKDTLDEILTEKTDEDVIDTGTHTLDSVKVEGQNIDLFIESIKKPEEQKKIIKPKRNIIVSTQLEPIKIDQELDAFLKSVLIQ